ncbi:MAG: EAL domain-containing protein, partial [Lachnospiraceae bacterium]|nr:EAL domain-containing protein [Lachnospiraceae bacterium]
QISPDFIKVDIAIIRNIHQDEDKQQLVKNIVEYAHKRGMLIIAEGLEYPEEVEKSLDLGVDLLQGYFLAKPGAVPPEISETAYTLIQEYWRK